VKLKLDEDLSWLAAAAFAATGHDAQAVVQQNQASELGFLVM
jgi:hypothetical protein